MKKTQLSKAIAFALTGAALSFGAASTASAASTTMYNLGYELDGQGTLPTTDPTAGGTWHLSGVTDGWANGATTGTDAYSSPVGSAPVQNWAGTSSATTAAFGYTGAHLNWGFEITGGAGGTGTISTFDAHNTYGVYADIDTAKGAWSDNASGNTNNGTTQISSGWRHDLDMGLFKTDMTGSVTLSVQGILQSGTNFGFTIFKGMDTVQNYGHHGAWNSTNNEAGLTAASRPTPAAGALAVSDIVAYSVGGASPSNLNSITFNAEAGQIYSIWLGGYREGSWNDTVDGYSLSISQASPVPVPGAAWLFGGAIASLIGANRRKRVVPA